MTAYIVMVQSLIDGSAKVSGEGYTSLADAERFVLGRGDHPQRIPDAAGPIYDSARNRYVIHDVRILTQDQRRPSERPLQQAKRRGAR